MQSDLDKLNSLMKSKDEEIETWKFKYFQLEK
jgi:hypothetical protein